MNLGMELDHTENFLETAIDDEKVTDVAAKFDGNRIMNQMKDFFKRRKEHLENSKKNRKVKNASGFFPNETDDTKEYYTSYDDHLEKLNEEIENQKAAIERGLYRLKLLGIKEKNIMEERDNVTSDKIKLPDYLKYEGFEELMKEHIFRKHRKLIGDYFGEHKYSSHAGKLHIQPMYDKDGSLNKIICLDCYFKFLEENGFDAGNNPSKDDGHISINDKVGGSI